MQTTKYPVPSYLKPIFTDSTYARFLKEKAQNLRHKDLRRKRPCALTNSVARYRELLHYAIANGGQFDPYTGDPIDWTLIKKWDPDADQAKAWQGGMDFDKALYYSPAVDHIDPDSTELQLEICAWIVNSCKSVLNPADFIAICAKIAAYSNKITLSKKYSVMRKDARKYLLPPFLEGICLVAEYEHWLDAKAEDIYRRDLVLKRPYALNGSKAFYKELINKAVWDCGGIDPYTGDKLDFTLMSKWPSSKLLRSVRLDKAFYLLPVVDHTDPYAFELKFEICSWIVNECKGNLNPAEFLSLCEKITVYRRACRKRRDNVE